MPPVGTRARTTPGTVPTLRKALKRSAPSLGIERALWMSPGEVRAAQARLRSPLVLAVHDDWIGGARLPLSAVRDLA